MRIVDIHSHIQEKEFDDVRIGVLQRMNEADMGTIAVGCDEASSARAVALSVAEENVWACIGVHPIDTITPFNTSHFSGLIGAKKKDGTNAVVAVGECGLDYSRLTDISHNEQVQEKDRQKRQCVAQILFAKTSALPLMLHVRPSRGSDDAHQDMLALLRAYDASHGVVHFFTASLAVANEYRSLGFYISLSGVLTFDAALKEVAHALPLSSLLLETDAPYAAPVPLRGKKNEPAFVLHTAACLADIHGVSVEECLATVRATVASVFNV